MYSQTFSKYKITLRILNCILKPVHRCGAGCSMRACHAAGPGSIIGRDNFPGWGFSGIFPHEWVSELWVSSIMFVWSRWWPQHLTNPSSGEALHVLVWSKKYVREGSSQWDKKTFSPFFHILYFKSGKFVMYWNIWSICYRMAECWLRYWGTCGQFHKGHWRGVQQWYYRIRKKCVCSNANPLHYYVLRVPRKVNRWRWVWSIFKSRTAWADHITCGTSICYSVLELG